MKLGIVLGIIIGIILVAVAGIAIIVFVIFPITREVNAPITSSPAITSFAAASNTPKPASSTTGAATTSTTPKPTGTSTASANANVNFDLYISSLNTALTSATINAQLTNTGTADAHNVQTLIEAFQQGNRIKIDGQDYFRYDVGTLKAKETRQVQVTLNLSAIDALKVFQSGATLTLTINSTEKTQTMSYDYKP